MTLTDVLIASFLAAGIGALAAWAWWAGEEEVVVFFGAFWAAARSMKK